MKNEVWRLLRRNVSVAQLAGYAISNIAGLLIVLSGLQLYSDLRSESSSEDDLLATDDYIIISPRVDGLGSLISQPRTFSPDDVADLLSQPWAISAGEFKNAVFNVDAGVSFGGRGMSTDLFLESVPDEYIDVKPAGWDFEAGRSTVVPIIISKDYLALYNFGFAPSRSLPRISEEMVGMIPLTLSVSGNGRQQYFEGRIVGFSSRLNTIAVPESFLDWANETFGTSATTDPSRLIVKVDNPGNPAIAKYMEEHGYEIAGDNSAADRAGYVMAIVTGIVIAIGIVISVLSLAILLLSISLLMQRNREKISALKLLGYSPATIAGYYIKMVAAMNVFLLVIVTVALVMIRRAWLPLLSDLGLEGAPVFAAIIIGIALMSAITAINAIYIRRVTSRC